LGELAIKNIFRLSVILVLTLSITGCTQNANTDEIKVSDNSNIEEAQKSKVVIDTKEIINTLCSDDFEGRLAGSNGDDKTENYIIKTIKDLNLDPLFHGEYSEPYTQEVFKTYGITNENETLGNKEVHNLAGYIKGKDSSKAVVISAHFDHLGYQKGNIIRGALDNASGVAAVIRVADNLKKKSESKTFNQDIIFAFFDGEEEGLKGSQYFVKDIKGQYTDIYDINIDCIGGKQAGKISLNNKSKISDKLTNAMRETFKENNTEFSDVELKGGTSDHRSFEKSGFPNIFIGQDNIRPYIHNATDTPDTLDFDEIDKVAAVVSEFVDINDGKSFKG
jgi:Zn-dependent M28 family amino/carboxypeptidase